jgi:hypothetical protein
MIARRKSTRGMSLTLVAVSMTAMFGVGALAIDLGMLYRAHSEAQVAAEAAALAGASVFLDQNPTSTSAHTRALQLAQANSILNSSVTAAEMDSFDFDLVNERVAVRVRRAGIGTWFAWALGEDSLQVRVLAAAGVTEANQTSCVTPIMIPDTWDEAVEDLDGSELEEPTENWTYDPDADSYGAFDPDVGFGGQTGYGSGFRGSSDFGRPITLKPQSAEDMGPRGYRLWKHEDEADADFEGSIAQGGVPQCDEKPFGVGDGTEFDVLPANRTLPMDLLRDRIAADSGQTSWNGSTVVRTGGGDWRSSPRVIKVAVFDPSALPAMYSGGGVQVEFNNVMMLLLEGVEDQGPGTISGRLLYYVSGSQSDPGEGGALVKHVKLLPTTVSLTN